MACITCYQFLVRSEPTEADVQMPGMRDDADLVKVARMYFQDGRSQQEIARDLGTSRSNVSRMISAARERGIVEIRIHDPAGRDGDLELQLADSFGLAEVRVAAFGSGADPLAAVGALGASWLLDNMRDHQTVALSWGSALESMVHAVTSDRPHDVDVVQLVGGLSPAARASTGQELVRELAARLGATYRYLHAPALFESAEARDAMAGEASTVVALQAAEHAHLALVGVGAIGIGSSEFVLGSMHLNPQERKEFFDQEPVGDVCGRFFDVSGRPVTGVVDNRVLGLSLAQLRNIPTVVGIASGAVKAPGLLGALRAGYLDVVICDSGAARALMAAARNGETADGKHASQSAGK